MTTLLEPPSQKKKKIAGTGLFGDFAGTNH
jgi:hypothetical protein